MLDNQQLLPPPKSLLSRNPLQWFRFFGPGAIIASVTIGSGELVFPARGGSMFGYNLLWVFLWCGFLKWILAYCSMRHMILTGAHPLERWNRLPGPTGWVPIMIIVTSIAFVPLVLGFLSGLFGEIVYWITNNSFDKYIWATVGAAAAVILIFLGGYNFMEKTQLVFVGMMLICALIAVIYIQPDWWLVLKHSFLPGKIQYFDWVLTKEPDLKGRSVWLEVLVAVSVIGGVTHDYLAYLAFLRDKKWGNCHRDTINQQEVQQIADQPRHPARLWLRAALVDTILSFIAVILIAICFSVLGTVLLAPAEKVIQDNLLQEQATFLAVLSPKLVYLYQISVFLAFFGILYSAPEMITRLIWEFFNSIPRLHRRVDEKKIRLATIIWGLGGGIAALWICGKQGIEPIKMITPFFIVMGVLFCGIYCALNVWMDCKFLPPVLRMPKILMALNGIAALVFLAAGVKGLWESKFFKSDTPLGVHAITFIVCLVIASMLLARALKPLYHYKRRSERVPLALPP